MTDIVAWLAFVMSEILVTIKLIEFLKNWKSPKVEIEIDYLSAKLIKKKNHDLVEFDKMSVEIINSGNEDIFIEGFVIEREVSPKGKIVRDIGKRFHLLARSSKKYSIENFGFIYTPKENKKMGKGSWDYIHLKAYFGKKIAEEKVYFIMSEETNSILVTRNEISKKRYKKKYKGGKWIIHNLMKLEDVESINKIKDKL